MKFGALSAALGNQVRFVLLLGNRDDTVGVTPLIHGLSCDVFLADKAVDGNLSIEVTIPRGATICISLRP